MVAKQKRLVRWLLATILVGGAVFLLSGNWSDPWLWAYTAVWSGCVAYAMWSIGEDLAEERRHPPSPGADRHALRAIRLLAVAHLVVAALDTGRWHLAPVPSELRAAALAGMGLGFWLVFRAM